MNLVEEGGGAPIDPKLISRIGAGAAVAAFAFGVACLFLDPKIPGLMALACALAATIVALAMPGRMEVTGRRTGRKSTAYLLAAALGVAFPAFEFHLVAEDVLLAAAAGGAGLCLVLGAAAAIRSADLSGKVQFAVVITLLGGAIGYGGAGVVDVCLDASPGQVFQTILVSKDVSYGSKSTTYWLHLGPWGPIADQNSLSVSYALYNDLNQGDPVCLTLHPGTLGDAWFTPAVCQPSAKP